MILFINVKELLESLVLVIIKRYKRMGYNMDILRQSACLDVKVRKMAKIRNQYIQVPHLT